MKELTIKEKAKAYDYAVKKAKELILNENGVVRVDKPLFDELFPSEMEESEDERIRKDIIEHITLCSESIPERASMLAWLDKQGEKKHQYKSRPRYVGEEELLGANKQDDHKPADKVEPKFKIGDWVVTDKCDTVQIRAVNNGYYTLYNGMIF